jgi:hypothetical protein
MKRELDARITGEGDEVRLVWDDGSGELELELHVLSGSVHRVRVSSESALDALAHPHLYLVTADTGH